MDFTETVDGSKGRALEQIPPRGDSEETFRRLVTEINDIRYYVDIQRIPTYINAVQCS